MNDKEEKVESSELNVLALVAYSFLTAIGISTFVFSPLGMILAHARLAEPWGKVSAILGAMFSLFSFLETPLPLVILGFVFGLLVADSVTKSEPVWRSLTRAVGVTALLGLGIFLVGAHLQGQAPAAFWSESIRTIVSSAQQLATPNSDIQWADVEQTLYWQGPFLMLAFICLSFWLSIGFVAHLRWFPESHEYSGTSLRKMTFPTWLGVGFLGLLIGVYFLEHPYRTLLSSSSKVIMAFVFIRGCVNLSWLMNRFLIKPPLRTFLYLLLVVPGFYLVVGMGVFGPWFRKYLSPDFGKETV